MKHATRDRICGTLVIAIALAWTVVSFRHNAVMAMNFRRDMNYVELNITETLRVLDSRQNRDVLGRAMIFNGEIPMLRGSQENETFDAMTKRWINWTKASYWPQLLLLGIGVVLWLPTKAK